MAAGLHPPHQNNRPTHRRDAKKTRQSSHQPLETTPKDRAHPRANPPPGWRREQTAKITKQQRASGSQASSAAAISGAAGRCFWAGLEVMFPTAQASSISACSYGVCPSREGLPRFFGSEQWVARLFVSIPASIFGCASLFEFCMRGRSPVSWR